MKTLLHRTHSLLLAVAMAAMMTACSATAARPAGTTPANAATTSATASTSITSPATVPAATAQSSVSDAMAGNATPHEAVAEASANANEIAITLNSDSITADAAGVLVEGSTAQITAAGVYRISGTLNNGQISVNAPDGEVQLILDGVTIHNETGAAIDIVKAGVVTLILADNSQNTLSDGAKYVFSAPDVDEPNATLFSKADLTIEGAGALTVQGNYNDAIASKDGLVIASGQITVTAVDDGIRGKDYLVVKNGNLNITSKGDGLKSDNAEDAGKGYITVEDGTIAISAGGDAIQAETDVLISGGNFNVTAGGGSGATLAADASAKGLKAGAELTIDGGTFNIDAADDALHTNGTLILNAGTFDLASGDDAIHADVALTINDGTVRISRSNEGIESNVITINGGDIHVVSSDDGINSTDGSGGGMRPGGGNVTTYSGNTWLYIHGGRIVVNAAGDGVDVNGATEMTAGTLVVHGPTMQMNGALDFDAYFKISGGTLVAAGSAGMAQAPGAGSQQASVLIFFNAVQPAGTLVHIRNAAGEGVLTFAPEKEFQSLVFSSPALIQGETYEILLGGSATGASAKGLFVDGSYTHATAYQQYTINAATTMVGDGGMRRRGPMP